MNQNLVTSSATSAQVLKRAVKSGGELLGLIGLDSIDAAHASAELSFLLHERFSGQGDATKAAARPPATLNYQPSTLNLQGRHGPHRRHRSAPLFGFSI